MHKYDVHNLLDYTMAPQTAWGWFKIAYDTADALYDAKFISESDKSEVALLINNTYVEASDKAKGKSPTDSEGAQKK